MSCFRLEESWTPIRCEGSALASDTRNYPSHLGLPDGSLLSHRPVYASFLQKSPGVPRRGWKYTSRITGIELQHHLSIAKPFSTHLSRDPATSIHIRQLTAIRMGHIPQLMNIQSNAFQFTTFCFVDRAATGGSSGKSVKGSV